MKMSKRILAMLLALCMTVSVVPFAAFATETADETTAPVETVAAETVAATEAAVEETTAPAAETEPEILQTELELEADVLNAITLGAKPTAGTMTGEPFNDNKSLTDSTSAEHTNYRIPGLVKLNNGTLVAAADIRYDYEYDGGGSDIVISTSADNGKTWNYSFPAYLGDNGNKHALDSSTLMDPLLITDGTNLYLFYDLFPAGFSLGGGSNTTHRFADAGGKGTGFDNNGRLLLSTVYTSTDCKYYLENGKIYDSDEKEQSGYTVDAWFNVYQNGTYVSNLFFADSPFYAYPTSYIAMQTYNKATGEWSDPELVPVKHDGIAWQVLGPGSGIVTSSRELAFTVYNSDSSISLVYGTSGSWKTVKTSGSGEAVNESSIVELSDGTIRAFIKNDYYTIRYVDFTKNADGTYSAGSTVNTGVRNSAWCMVSSMKYSGLINGQEAILVCCPTDQTYTSTGNSKVRCDGTIYVFTLDGSNNMTLLDSYTVTTGYDDHFFAYSDMVELDDGSVMLLYEDGCLTYNSSPWSGKAAGAQYSHIAAQTFAITDLIPSNAVVTYPEDSGDSDDNTVTGKTTLTDANSNITITVAEPVLSTFTATRKDTPNEAHAGYSTVASYEFVITKTDGKPYTGEADIKIPYDADTFGSCNMFLGDVSGEAFMLTLADGYFTGKAPHFSDVDVNGTNTVSTTVENITLNGGGTASATQNDLSNELTNANVSNGNSSVVGVSISSKPETTGGSTVYVRGDEATSITSGNQYVIASGNTTLTTSGTSYSTGTLPASGAEVASTGMWTITSSGSGYTISQVIDGTRYYMNTSQNSDGDVLGGWTYTYTRGMTTTASNAAIWSFDGNKFYISLQTGQQGIFGGTTASTNHYLSVGSTSVSTTSSTVTLYDVDTETVAGTTTYDHTITFTGLAVGNTQVSIGNVTYNVTVNANHIPVTLDAEKRTYTTDKDALSASADAITNTNPSVASVSIVDGKLVIKALKAGTTTVTDGYNIYNVTVNPSTVNVSVAPGTSKTFVAIGTTVTGATADVTATIANGTLTIAAPEGATEGATATIVDGFITYNVSVASDIEDFTAIVGTKSYSDTASTPNTVDITGESITKLTISERTTFSALGVDASGYDSVIWESADTSIATVNANGEVTGVAAGNTTVTATVTKGGVSESISIPVQVIPTLVKNSNATTDNHFTYIAQEDNVDAYYSLYSNNGYALEMVPVQKGEVIYFSRDVSYAYGIMWTSAPEEGYSLAYMAATGTKGEYLQVHTGDRNITTLPTTENGVTYFAGSTPFNNLTGSSLYGADADKVKTSLLAALKSRKDGGLGIDGAMSMGRKAKTDSSIEPLVTSLSFAANKLPTVDKKLNGVLPTSHLMADFRRYTGEEMIAAVDEYVYFTITVEIAAPNAWLLDANNKETNTSATTYTDATLTDKLDGAYFYTKDQDTNSNGVIEDNEGTKLTSQNVTDILNAEWTEAEIKAGKRVREFYVVFVITQDYVDKDIINQVEFKYTHNSKYSKGTNTAEHNAFANIHVLGSRLDDIALDFGLAIQVVDTDGKKAFKDIDVKKTIDMRDMDNDGNADYLKYGTIDISNVDGHYVLTYTPTAVLTARDPVFLYNSKGESVNYFFVYPTTTVYYEENFDWKWDSKWTHSGTAKDTVQTTQYLGKSDNYGYGLCYSDDGVGASNGTQATSDTLGAKGTFTFTGTGFDLYANCTADTGWVAVQVKQNTSSVKMFLVNTKAASGDTSATTGQNAVFYSLPIVSYHDLNYGTYEVVVTKVVDSKPVNIDGIRIHGTIQEAEGTNSIYYADKEDHPTFVQMRDMVLYALNVGNDTSEQYGDLEKMPAQVYDEVTAKAVANGTADPVAVVLTNSSFVNYSNEQVQDLLDNGPKNELYLYAGQSLTFSVSTNRVMQIGLKAPAGTATYSITGGTATNSGTINSSVDMFYTVTDKADAVTDYTITVTNTGESGILSVTDLKICDDPSAFFAPLTEEDIKQALIAMGLLPEEEKEEETPAPSEPEATEPETTEPEATEPEVTIPEIFQNPFIDVSEAKYYFESVLWAFKEGITTGKTENTFQPDSFCTRAQIVTFLWRAMGSPEPASNENPFTDVKPDAYYYKAVLWAVQNGITTGKTETTFEPSSSCTRAQVVTFLWRNAGKPAANGSNPFADVASGKYYTDAVLWAMEKGITTGKTATTFLPNDTCTRGQIVTFLFRDLAK